MYADDGDSPDRVKEYRDHNHAMNGTLDEPQDERPSASLSTLGLGHAIDWLTFEVSS